MKMVDKYLKAKHSIILAKIFENKTKLLHLNIVMYFYKCLEILIISLIEGLCNTEFTDIRISQ